jgi:hypothetical protein
MTSPGTALGAAGAAAASRLVTTLALGRRLAIVARRRHRSRLIALSFVLLLAVGIERRDRVAFLRDDANDHCVVIVDGPDLASGVLEALFVELVADAAQAQPLAAELMHALNSLMRLATALGARLRGGLRRRLRAGAKGREGAPRRRRRRVRGKSLEVVVADGGRRHGEGPRGIRVRM